MVLIKIEIWTVLVFLGCLAIVCSTTLDEGNSRLELPHENTISKLVSIYKNDMWMKNQRVKRSMKEDIEKGFKEFSEKVSKLPDQMNASMKKYFEEKGISMESIQKILNEIWAAVQKLIDEVKKAM